MVMPKDNMKVLQLIFCLQITCLGAKMVIVKTANGKVRGSEEYTVPNGNKYTAFKAIRYAEVPERFEPSVPVQNWNNIYDATEDKEMCMQLPKSIFNESEDCLYISVYTPKIMKKCGGDVLPVMFWVYGGAFNFGDNTYNHYGPDYLLDNGVVVVTINYRVNVFGFLSTGNETLPGNNGIKDIILGLKWVQTNIREFGGDPNEVTVFGQSAGAVIITYLLYSPLVVGKGYFHRAIAESGNALVPWGLQGDPAHVYKLFAEQSNCSQHQGHKEVLKCLKVAPTELIRNASQVTLGAGLILGFDMVNGVSFAPVIEHEGPTSAIIEKPHEALINGKIHDIPIIVGFNSEEGLYMAPFIQYMGISDDVIEKLPALLVPPNVKATATEKQTIGQLIKKHYYGDPSLTTFDARIVRYVSDAMFNHAFRQYLFMLKNYPVQCYEFDYSSPASAQYMQFPGLDKVGHEAEINFLFRRKQSENVNITTQDRTLRQIMTKLWTNFAKTGNPTPSEKDCVLQNIKWPNARREGSNVQCLYINNKLSIIKNPKEDEYQFWKNIYGSYGSTN